MADSVQVTNTPGDETALGWMGQYYQNEHNRKQELDVEMLVWAALAIAQMSYYWDKVDDHTKDRDCAIGKYEKKDMGMLGFLAELEDYRDRVDYPILKMKASIKDQINFAEWAPNSCESAMRYTEKLEQDAKVLDKFEESFAACSCAGVPEGWGMHDGSLAYGLGAAYAGPIMNIAEVEMFESFKGDAISIVQQAQAAMKAIYNISGIMRYYEQAIGIHEGLASMFIQGFNSAGAMLGTALGKLASSSSGGGTTVSTAGISGSSSTPIPIGTTASQGVR